MPISITGMLSAGGNAELVVFALTACRGAHRCPPRSDARATDAQTVSATIPADGLVPHVSGYVFGQQCIRTDDGRFAVQVEITATYQCDAEPTENNGCADPITSLWQWYCEADDTCSGIHASPIIPGRAISVGDLNRVGGEGGARVVSRTGDVVIVAWGPLRTFTIDFARGIVAHAESGQAQLSSTRVNGRGEGRCRVQP